MTKYKKIKVCYDERNKKKTKFKSKSALVLSLFVVNVIHTSGAIPVISEGIKAYADVYYSYSVQRRYRQQLAKIRYGPKQEQRRIKTP